MTTKECPGTDRLRSYSHGTLVESESERVFGHVQSCSTCLLELQNMDQVDEFGDSLIEILKTGSETRFDGEAQCETAVTKAKSVFQNGSTKSDLVEPLGPKSMGDYEIVRLLGHGGMGSVYLANHEKLGRQVALKLLSSHRRLDPQMEQRFSLEMRAIGALSHPNIVTAFDAREIDGTTVLVTEYIDGLDLGKVLNRLGKLSVRDACQIGAVIARALAYTDERGFVHRDIKPSNIMLSSKGIIKVLDLGLARIAFAGPNPMGLTVTGQAMGSPDYVAPEQINDGRAVDGRADLYSLGCTLFKMLSGRNVFDNTRYASSFAKMTAHVSVVPPSLRSEVPDADDRLVRLVGTLLEKEPDKRPQSAEEVAISLEVFANGSNLLALIERALKTPEVFSSDRPSSPQPFSIAKLETKSSMKRTVPVTVAIGGGLLGTFVGLFMGIIITITNPDGSQTKITVPDGTRVAIETVDKLPSGLPTPSVVGRSEPPKSAPPSFLNEGTRQSLPTLKNVKLLSSNKPGRLKLDKVALPVVEPGEVFISNSDSNSRVSPVLMLDSKSKTVAVSTSPMPQMAYNPGVVQRSQIYVGQLPFGPFKEVVSTESPFTLLDHDSQTGQSLGVLGEMGTEGDRELVLFDGLLDGSPRETYRQRLPGQRGQRSTVSQAKLVAMNQATVVLNGTVFCWDLSDGTQVFQTDPARPFQTKVSFSLDRKWMTLVDTSGVHIVDTKTGMDLGFIRMESLSPSTAPFDKNGNRIALCSEDAWSIYDLETMEQRKPQTATWKIDGRLSGWIGPDLLLAENGVVLHTERQVPVWKFHSASLAATSRQSECAIWEDSISFVERQNGLRIRTLAMPHETLKDALKSMPSVEDMMLTGPGTKVRLEFKLPDPLPKEIDAGLLKSKMTEIIQRSKWEIDDQAKLQLVVQFAPGKPFTTQYFSYPKSDGTSPLNPQVPVRPEQVPVEITPMISTLQLRSGEKLEWFMESYRVFGGQHINYSNQLMLANNNGKQKTKEEFVEEMQRARPEFFYGIMLPTRISRQPYTHGLGASKELGNSWVPSSAFP